MSRRALTDGCHGDVGEVLAAGTGTGRAPRPRAAAGTGWGLAASVPGPKTPPKPEKRGWQLLAVGLPEQRVAAAVL